MYYGSFEAPNGCVMEAVYDAGRLSVYAHPPGSAPVDFMNEAENWARVASRDWFGSYEEANAHLYQLGVPVRVFDPEG